MVNILAEGDHDYFDRYWNDAAVLYQESKNFSNQYYTTMMYGYGNNPEYLNPRYLNAVSTDYSSNISSFQLLINNLKTQINYYDVLTIYIQGHGASDGINGSFFLRDGTEVTDFAFKALLDEIPFKKRIVIDASCSSGAFKDNFQDYKTLFISAADAGELSQTCDDQYPDYPGEKENEPWTSGISHHGEFDYHLLNALRQFTIGYNHPIESDLNDDEEISFNEMVSWVNNSDLQGQKPQYYSYGNLGEHTFINPTQDLKWENILVLSNKTITNDPYLVWGENQDLSGITKYKIYRQISECEVSPEGGSEVWIGTTSSTNFQFTDSSFDPSGGDYTFTYKIKAFNCTQSSGYSNEVTLCGDQEWSNALFMTIDGNPRLAWGPYSLNIVLYGYNIYRSVNNGAFNYIGYVNSSTYEYSDTEYGYDPQGVSLQYYIKARLNSSGTSLSSASNTVNTNGYSIEKELPELNKEYDYILSANYPNPFNPSTKINYSIRKAGNVKLEVFDIYGSRTAVLVDGIQKEGEYSVNFDGSRLASGVYVYRLQTGDFISTRKMTLLK